ncbi:MAG: glycosyltransferase family 2 protein [Desulfuromonadales bacterium]
MTSSPITFLHGKLEIVLVTYNRASSLDSTLRQLAASPFNKANVTVYDNCSTDATPDICRKYCDKLHFMSVVRHEKHIGTNAGYLHAVENVGAEYGWILNDDTILDGTTFDQLIKAVISDSYDMLYVGSIAALDWHGDESTTMAQLVAEKARVYTAFSLWPALIFKTSLYDDACIVKGYRLANCVYPNFPFVRLLVEMDARVYVSAKQVVRTETNSINFDGLYWFAAWINYCQTIKQKELRERTIDEVTHNYGFFKTLVFLIAFDETRGSILFWSKIVDIIWGLPSCQRMKFLILIPLMVFPLPHTMLKKMRQRYLEEWGHSGDVRPFLPDAKSI